MLWEAVGVALAAAFSPWALLIVAYLLTQPRPKLLALVFLATAASITLAVGIAVVLALNGSGVDDTRRHRTVPAALDLAFGLAILVLAAVIARRPPHTRKERRREMGLLSVVTLGAVMGSPSLLYLSSLHSIAKGHPGTPAAVAEVVLIAAIVLLMAEAPIALFILAPERTTTALNTANEWLTAHGRTIAVSVASVVGAYFTVSGLAHLL